MWALLNCDVAFLLWLAPVCTSFSAVNVGTSKRSPTTPWGDVSRPYIVLGNCLASRSILLTMLATALGGTWILEQPGSSLMQWLLRMEHLRVHGIPHYVVQWWARHYGALTPKLVLGKLHVLQLNLKQQLFADISQSLVIK